jgi:hypothetical protein
MPSSDIKRPKPYLQPVIIPADAFIHRMNDRMACQARKFVYGLDDGHMEFVYERLGRMESAAPGDAA